MSAFIVALLKTIYVALDIYLFIIIVAVIVDWLRVFGVINTYNKFVYALGNFLYRMTDPVYRQIRKVVPPIGNLDLSPIILILIIYFTQNLILETLMR